MALNFDRQARRHLFGQPVLQLSRVVPSLAQDGECFQKEWLARAFTKAELADELEQCLRQLGQEVPSHDGSWSTLGPLETATPGWASCDTREAMATYVLIPGADGSAWYWHRVAPLLELRGHQVVAVDLPVGDPAAGLEQYVDAVMARPFEPPHRAD